MSEECGTKVAVDVGKLGKDFRSQLTAEEGILVECAKNSYGSHSEASMNLTGPQKRAYDFVKEMLMLQDLYDLEISFGDECLILSDDFTGKVLAQWYGDELHLEVSDSEEDH